MPTEGYANTGCNEDVRSQRIQKHEAVHKDYPQRHKGCCR
jgi:hypothetical protein